MAFDKGHEYLVQMFMGKVFQKRSYGLHDCGSGECIVASRPSESDLQFQQHNRPRFKIEYVCNALFGMLNETDWSLTYVNAGHNSRQRL